MFACVWFEQSNAGASLKQTQSDSSLQLRLKVPPIKPHSRATLTPAGAAKRVAGSAVVQQRTRLPIFAENSSRVILQNSSDPRDAATISGRRLAWIGCLSTVLFFVLNHRKKTSAPEISGVVDACLCMTHRPRNARMSCNITTKRQNKIKIIHRHAIYFLDAF